VYFNINFDKLLSIVVVHYHIFANFHKTQKITLVQMHLFIL